MMCYLCFNCTHSVTTGSRRLLSFIYLLNSLLTEWHNVFERTVYVCLCLRKGVRLCFRVFVFVFL